MSSKPIQTIPDYYNSVAIEKILLQTHTITVINESPKRSRFPFVCEDKQTQNCNTNPPLNRNEPAAEYRVSTLNNSDCFFLCTFHYNLYMNYVKARYIEI